MSSNNRNRRWAGGVGLAVSAAFAAALIGLANAPAARADTDPDPFEDLFGSSGINTWTASADNALGVGGGGFDTSVDSFLAGVPRSDDPITVLVAILDPSAFSGLPLGEFGLPLLGAPINGVGDLAVGLDYSNFASGLAPTLDPIINPIDTILNLLINGLPPGFPFF
jgi:hypothetical protein